MCVGRLKLNGNKPRDYVKILVYMILKGRALQYVAAMVASMSFFISGSFTCWTSPALPQLLKDNNNITFNEVKWIVSLLGVGCMIAPLPAGRLADFYGRRFMLVTAAVPFLAAWTILMFAKSTLMLCISRVIGGLGIGISITVCPIYIGEIADRNIRGHLESFIQLFQNLGAMFEFCLGSYVQHRMLSFYSFLFPVVFTVLMSLMPESPYYFIMKSQIAEAEKSLWLLRGGESFQEEFVDIKYEVEHERRHKVPFLKLFVSRGNRKAMCIVGTLALIQQLSGIMVILSQAETVFKATGSTLEPSESAMILGGLQLVASILISFLVDKLGRKPLLLVSAGGSALSLIVAGICAYLQTETNIQVSGWLPLCSLLFFIIVYCLGLGSIPLALAGELFPTNIKELAAALGSMTIALGFFIATILYEIIALKTGIYCSFWVSAFFCCWGIIFIALFVPETKGKSLIQILIDMRSFVPDEIVKADLGCLKCANEVTDELEEHFSFVHTEEGLILETKSEGGSTIEVLYTTREMGSMEKCTKDENEDVEALDSAEKNVEYFLGSLIGRVTNNSTTEEEDKIKDEVKDGNDEVQSSDSDRRDIVDEVRVALEDIFNNVEYKDTSTDQDENDSD